MQIVQTRGLGPAATDTRVERELTAVTWRNYGKASAVEPLVAAAFGYVAYADLYGSAFAIWAGWAILAYVSRFLLWFRWSRISSAGDWNHRRWGLIFHAHSFASILIWIGSTVAFLPALEPINQALLIAIVCGIAGGGTILVSSYLPAMFTNIGGLMATLAATAFLQTEASLHVIGFLAVVYVAYLISVGRDHHAALRLSFRLRFERAEMIDRLETALLAAEEASRSKSAFLANMSHELRTPLNAILGFSELLKAGKQPESCEDQERSYAAHIHESGQHLLNLVDDILDLSKADEGCLRIDEKEVDLRRVAAESQGMIEPVAQRSGIHLVGPVLDDSLAGSAWVRGDELRLRQVMLNLLSNAVKFSPQGSTVTLTIAPEPSGDLRIGVADEGIGMDEDQARLVLQRFAQVEDVYSRSHQGTGLGLPITKTLVELHGGTLNIDSRKGVGTKVVVTLPADRVSRRGAPARPEPVATGSRPAFF